VSGSCKECKSALRGPTCALCSNARGCAALRPDLKHPTCDKNITYSIDTQVKTYSCDGENIAGGVVAPGLAFECNRTSIAGLEPLSLNPSGAGPFVDVAKLAKAEPDTQGSDGGFCSLMFSVKSDMDKPVMCLTWGCLFQDGSGRVECLKLRCDCPTSPTGKCATAIQAVLPKLSENASIDCNPKTSVCEIGLKGLPLSIEAPCVAGECVDPKFKGNATGTVFTSKKDKNWAFAVSSIPIAAAVALAVLLLAVTIPRMLATMHAVSAVKHRGGIVDGRSWSAGGGAPLNHSPFLSSAARCQSATGKNVTASASRLSYSGYALQHTRSDPNALHAAMLTLVLMLPSCCCSAAAVDT
jgi:hypothetical protein